MSLRIRHAVLFCIFCLPTIAQAAPALPKKSPGNLSAASSARAAKSSASLPVTVTIPAAALRQTLEGLLPLSIDEIGSKDQFHGTVAVESISKLSIENGQLNVSGQLMGRNMTMNANVGNQSIQIKLGSLVLPVNCAILLRFDPKKKVLVLVPSFQSMAQSSNPADENMLALLNGLNREYKVPLDNFMPLSWRMDEGSAHLLMEPMEIRAEDGMLTLLLRPVARRKP